MKPMAHVPGSLLTEEEMVLPRTPSELAAWVDEKCDAFADKEDAREWVLLHQGLSKKFHEEVFPLSRFVSHVFSGREDVSCTVNLDDRDFDATIFDYSTSPASELKVEITSAIDGRGEHLRMKCLLEHGHVSAWGTVYAKGTERSGHEIEIDDGMVDHRFLMNTAISLIRKAAKRKSMTNKGSNRYGSGHILIIAFDDWCWFKPKDASTLRLFLRKEIAKIPLNFAMVYVVGLSGKTCFEVERDAQNSV